MYLVGAAHPYKRRLKQLLTRFIEARDRLVTSTEVFQEILHRYTAIRRRDAIDPAWQLLDDVTDEVFSISFPLVNRARELVLELDAVSARHALHAAVMESEGIERILSFDSGFEALPGIRRLF